MKIRYALLNENHMYDLDVLRMPYGDCGNACSKLGANNSLARLNAKGEFVNMRCPPLIIADIILT